MGDLLYSYEIRNARVALYKNQDTFTVMSKQGNVALCCLCVTDDMEKAQRIFAKRAATIEAAFGHARAA